MAGVNLYGLRKVQKGASETLYYPVGSPTRRFIMEKAIMFPVVGEPVMAFIGEDLFILR